MNAVSNDGGAVLSVRPKLPNKPVVIIDNAKYNSRQTEESKATTTAWRVEQIRDWLPSKGKSFDAKDTKPILLGISREMFVQKISVLEELTTKLCTSTGKDILLVRLPVGHPELNAIELIWALVKTEVAKKNTCSKSVTCST